MRIILYIIVAVSLFTSASFAQVGIGIEKISKNKNLDIDGGLRLGDVPPAYPIKVKEDGTLIKDEDINSKDVDIDFLTGALVVDIKGNVSHISLDSLPAFLKTNKIRYLEYAFPYDTEKPTPPGKQMIKGTELEFEWLNTALFYTNTSKDDMEVNIKPSKRCYVRLHVFTNTQAAEYSFGGVYEPDKWHFPALDIRASYIRFKTKISDIKVYQFNCFVPDMKECFFVDMYFSPVEWVTKDAVTKLEKKQRVVLATYVLSYPTVVD